MDDGRSLVITKFIVESQITWCMAPCGSDAEIFLLCISESYHLAYSKL